MSFAGANISPSPYVMGPQPPSSTTNAPALWDGTSGRIVKDCPNVTINPSTGDITAAALNVTDITMVGDLNIVGGSTTSTGPSTFRDCENSWRHIGGSSQTLLYTCGMATNAASTTFTLTTGIVYAMSFVAPARGGSLDLIGCRITTGVAAQTVRLALYDTVSDSNVFPNDLLAESGTVSAATSGSDASYNFGGTPYALTPGQRYWVALNSSSSSVAVAALPTGGSLPIGVPNLGSTTTPSVGWFTVHAYGAYPDPFPTALSGGMTSIVPKLSVRFSA